MSSEAQPELAVYLYGFTKNPPSLPLVNGGAGDLPSILSVDDQHPLSVHQYAGLTAIISSVVLGDYTGDVGENNVQNIAWLTPRACRHALVIGSLMEQGAVYPLSFGTLFSNLSALEQEMKQCSTQVLAVLEHIAGCQEWSLEARLDRKQAVDVLLTEGLQSGRFCLPEGAGRRHLEEQKLRRMLTGELNGWLAECLTSLQNELSPFMRDFRSRRLLDDKVLNWAYLLPVEKVAGFQRQVSAISSRYQAYGFSFRVTGPWAAYSFSRLTE